MVTTRQLLDQEEEKLARILSRFYRNIKRDLNLSLTSGRVSWYDIQRLYKPRTEEAIRSAVTVIYEISARKTVEKDIKRPFFMTQTDLSEIRKYTQKYSDWWWYGLRREILNKTVMAYDPLTLLRMNPKDIRFKDTFIYRMAASLHGEVAADAVISKARQVVIGTGRRIPAVNTTNRTVFRTAAAVSGPILVWRTAQDERLCPDCEALDGEVFAIDDPHITMPVSDTHPNCRCELVLVDAAESEIESIEDLIANQLL